jgi:predicted transcriptional regulator
MKTYKDFMSEENVSKLREGTMAILYEEALSPTELSKKIGIWPTTMHKFLNEEGGISLVTLMKIDDYIKEWSKK